MKCWFMQHWGCLHGILTLVLWHAPQPKYVKPITDRLKGFKEER